MRIRRYVKKKNYNQNSSYKNNYSKFYQIQKIGTFRHRYEETEECILWEIDCINQSFLENFRQFT